MTVLSGLFIIGTTINCKSTAQVPAQAPETAASSEFLEDINADKITDTLEALDSASGHCPADKQALVDSWLPENWNRFGQWLCGALYKHGWLTSSQETSSASDDPFGE